VDIEHSSGAVRHSLASGPDRRNGLGASNLRHEALLSKQTTRGDGCRSTAPGRMATCAGAMSTEALLQEP
jgi:hypothetical protein